jgi:16S rRNA (uracil1498-N3)-methyltransferase
MQLFYVTNVEDNTCYLSEEESKHGVRVLRLKNGDCITVTDGKGNLYDAMIEIADFKCTRIRIIDIHPDYEKRNYHLHIGIAPTKNIDRFEWFLEKSTEIGIDEITPIITEHSERDTVKPDRLERIVISAMKLSLKAYKPELHPIQSLSNFLEVNNLSKDIKFIAHCSNDFRPLLKNIYTQGMDTTIIIGPEGDFSEVEISSAIYNGYQPVSLGKSRLRTETAGITACHTINLLNEL